MEINLNRVEWTKNSIELNRIEQNRCIIEQGTSRTEHKWNTKGAKQITVEVQKENNRMKIQLNIIEKEQNRTQQKQNGRK